MLKIEGNFNVTGPLETFANAGGVHLARAILAEFAENVAKLMAAQTTATGKQPPLLQPQRRGTPPEALARQVERRAAGRQQPLRAQQPQSSVAAKILWRSPVSWLRQVFSGREKAQ